MTTTPIVDFLNRFTSALGIAATVEVEETADGHRLNLAGDDAELLVRHRGEPLKALQHVVDVAYGRLLDGERRGFFDALQEPERKNIQLRPMAALPATKAEKS